MPKSKIFIVTFIVTLIAIASLFLLSWYDTSTRKNSASNSTNTPKILVSTSFYPLAEFTTQVGGSLVEVKNMTPAGMEPHDFEPSSNDISDVYKSKLFIYNGSGLESWTEKLKPQIENEGVRVINMSSKFDLLKADESVDHAEQDKDHDNKYDPHIWLNPVLAAKKTRLIADNLKEVDEKNSLAYEQNSQKYVQKLNELDNQFRLGLKNCGKKEVVISHDFLGYLAKEYDFKSVYISGISPESEPSSKELADIVDVIRKRGIKFILAESLVSQKLVDTVAKETGTQILTLNPLESLSDEEIKSGKNYISIQQENLKVLQKAMDCN